MTTATSVALLHTAIGIDHTLPFVVLGRARKWSLGKVLAITALCGLGHVLSSVVLGALGIALGIGVSKLTTIEASRGSLAAWLLIVFGLAYAGWSFARQRRAYRHIHEHDGHIHVHPHDPHHPHHHAHLHDASRLSGKQLTFWGLFIIFVLGPCEPLIPLLMVPAATMGVWGTFWVALVFGTVTIGTMLLLVTLGYYALQVSLFRPLERYANTLAGLAIAVSGMAIKLFGI
ncbi:MAG: hypothetical protein D6812_05635 [Deltaproteobacteria bacterium]|nr:MAG: hypothetical protein D6812_05635 [Deltaproteobacteria bacterium]